MTTIKPSISDFDTLLMRASLMPFPGSACDAVTALEAELRRQDKHLYFRYLLHGAMNELRLPPKVAPGRADNLWQHSCLEAFVWWAGQPTYFEFNFSPAGEWAAYRFRSYREGAANADVPAPQITVLRSHDLLELSAAVDLGADAPASTWRIGLSAVIEESDGRKSYWALAHPRERPDFHHRDSFLLEIGA